MMINPQSQPNGSGQQNSYHEFKQDVKRIEHEVIIFMLIFGIFWLVYKGLKLIFHAIEDFHAEMDQPDTILWPPTNEEELHLIEVQQEREAARYMRDLNRTRGMRDFDKVFYANPLQHECALHEDNFPPAGAPANHMRDYLRPYVYGRRQQIISVRCEPDEQSAIAYASKIVNGSWGPKEIISAEVVESQTCDRPQGFVHKGKWTPYGIYVVRVTYRESWWDLQYNPITQNSEIYKRLPREIRHLPKVPVTNG